MILVVVESPREVVSKSFKIVTKVGLSDTEIEESESEKGCTDNIELLNGYQAVIGRCNVSCLRLFLRRKVKFFNMKQKLPTSMSHHLYREKLVMLADKPPTKKQIYRSIQVMKA